MRFCLYIALATVVLSATTLRAGVPGATRRGVALSAKVVPVVRADPRSGQMVRTVVIAPRVVESRVIVPLAAKSDIAPSPDPSEMKDLVAATARDYDLNPELVESVIQVESNYNPYAVSPKGAQGLMQLMPATARRFGVKNSFDPKQNIEGGVRYLKFLNETFKDERLAVAAYNAGEGAVQKYGNVPPYRETVDYVAKVGKRYGQARRASEAKRSAQVKTVSAPKPPEYRRLAQFVDAEGRVFLTTQ